MTLGIIDVGTNSIHLLVGVLGLTGKFHVLVRERELTRLGDGGLAKRSLTASAMRRAKETLRQYRAILDRCRVDHIEAVATSAVRDASNGREFVEQIRRMGLPLRIISGREEARLIYLGVLQGQRRRASTLMVTIGGGSAQVMHGQGARLDYAASVPLGGARLAERFIRHDPARDDELDVLERAVLRGWRPVVRGLDGRRWTEALGCSATICQLMTAAYLRRHTSARKKPEQLVMTRVELARLVNWLKDSTSEDRIALDGLDPRREDLALPTAVALLAWMELCGVARIHYAPGSLREGLVMDYMLRHHRRGRPQVQGPLAELFAADGIRNGTGKARTRRGARLARRR